MRKIIITIIILFFFIWSNELLSCDEATVDSIKTNVESIKNLIASCTKVKKEFADEILTAYYNEDELVKILTNKNTKGAIKNFEIFFKNGHLIYILEINKRTLSNGISKDYNYYYFKDNKMICWQKNDLTYASENEIYQAKESNLLAKVDKCLLEIQ